MNDMESVRLISVTPDAEKLMGYCARVSSPSNQDNPEVAKLLTYCIKNGHWSVFEHAFMTVEIVTSRGIAPQILRHRSFTFQEFSQRYAVVSDFIKYEGRRQADKNRQSSVDDLSEDVKAKFDQAQVAVWDYAQSVYTNLLELGVAKECARFVLPSNARTTMYMTGSVRSWIHYLMLRTKPDVQLEHRRIALKIADIFAEQFPITATAMKEVRS
jgi:thymidylate synthase (FAD)